MNLFSFNNKWIHRFYIILKLTGIWWLFNMPYIFLGVRIRLAPDVASVQTIIIIGIGLLPFVAVPTTVATLAIARRYVSNEDGFPLFKVFLNYYKRDYFKSMSLGCLNAAMLVVFYLALRYYEGLSILLVIVFYAMLLMTPFFFLFVYSFLVDQELPLKSYLTNSMFFLLMHPVNTLLMVVANLVAAYMMWVVFPPLLLFVLPGLVVIIVTYFFQKSMAVEMKKLQTGS